MDEQRIMKIAEKFRSAIEAARNKGHFDSDIMFRNFPRGCCGDSSYLLAEYLKDKSIDSIWYSASRGDWTHAWLVVKDYRVKTPTKKMFTWPEDQWPVLKQYGVMNPEQTITIEKYEEDDLVGGIIIDITGDQFVDYSIPTYVGYQDMFHKSFSFVQAHDYDGLDARLRTLYKKIEQYL